MVHCTKNKIRKPRKSLSSGKVFFDGDVILKKNTLKYFRKYFVETKNLKILQGLWHRKFPYKTNFNTKHFKI